MIGVRMTTAHDGIAWSCHTSYAMMGHTSIPCMLHTASLPLKFVTTTRTVAACILASSCSCQLYLKYHVNAFNKQEQIYMFQLPQSMACLST